MIFLIRFLVYALVFSLAHVKTQTEFPKGKVWNRELVKALATSETGVFNITSQPRIRS